MSFRIKSIISVISLQLLVASALIWGSLFYLAEAYENELAERANFLVALLDLNIEQETIRSKASAENFIAGLKNETDVLYLRIIDKHGEVLAQTDGSRRPGRKTVPRKVSFVPDSDVLDFRIALNQNPHQMDFLELGLSTVDKRDALYGAGIVLVLISLLGVLLTGLVSFLLHRYYTNRLNDLQVAAERIASGDFGHQIELKEHDDLSNTVDSFNDMSVKLKTLYSDLQTTLHNSYKTSAELAGSEVRIRTILNNALDGIITIDELGKVLTVNPAAERIFDSDEDGVVGESISRFIPESYDQVKGTYRIGVNRSYTDRVNVRDELFAVSRRGNRIPIEFAVNEVFLGSKRIFIGQIRDISHQKSVEGELRRNKENLQRAQTTAQIGSWEYDRKFNELHCSDEFYRICGVPSDVAIEPHDFLDKVLEEDKPALRHKLIRLIRSRKPCDTEFRIVCPDGDIKNVYAYFECSTDENDQLIELYGVIQDITERRQAERKAQEASLEKAAAEAASSAKSSFLANMSHEIRTPMTAIIGFSESLSNGLLDNEQQKNAIKTIERNGKHLLNILNNILDLSKIEAGSIDIERRPVELFELLSEIETLSGQQAREKGLEFWVGYEYPLPTRIISDPVRLKQILINLCHNAIKFTENGSVRIIVSYQREYNKLIFSVIDTGIGMSTEQVVKVFNAFVQADSSTTRRFGGTGLGLNITKQFVERLGGKISCSSMVGTGSTFKVSIDPGSLENIEFVKEKPTVPIAIGKAYVDSTSALSGSILVAEDTPDNQRLISLYLEKTNAKFEIVDNGEVAVERAMENDYDLILMDVQMPVMDGLAAMSLLRQTGYKSPIVVLTAGAMKDEVKRCYDAGCDDLLTKPIVTGKLNDVLNRYLIHNASSTEDRPQQSSDGDEFQKLVHQFLIKLPDRLNSINLCAEQNDWDELIRLAHDLKGMGGAFGFPEITDASKIIVECCRSNKYQSAIQSVQDLNKAVKKIVVPKQDESVDSCSAGLI